jgi:Carboxypeptidase regulatory-like domain
VGSSPSAGTDGRNTFYKPLAGEYFPLMKTFARLSLVLLVSFAFIYRVHADAVATLYGTVKDAKGQPVQGAEIRIQGSDPNKIGKVHTDAKGRYSYAGLETGTYSVVLVVAGKTKASIGNVSTKSGEAQSLNFDLQGAAQARPFTKGKHYVWVPSVTGSNLGEWLEVENDGKQMPSGMAERLNNQGNNLVRQLQLRGADMPNQP